ncbi:transcriptional regulator BetI [Collimonas sp.]|jgi:TetR/AcrR family transcriptional repressor of bet genes|uniref:transcriptional regulator BetI n=1 Tax=Collimonas sp. TaxID=1963772 RepID=UPI002B81ED23|nr:transcriptional regulator BetI [Collimonas sp.]HWW99328.1 transcriptional regulator BetI [Collimonas sp.]
MLPLRRKQLIQATLEVIDRVGLADATIALIARQAGLSTGIISHYFGDKSGLLEATMRQILHDLSADTRRRREELGDDRAAAHLRAIVDANFNDSQVSGPVMKTWLAFWSSSMHQESLRRLQHVNDQRLRSNLCCQFLRELPLAQARQAARGLAAMIDGLWLRGSLAGTAFDADAARRLAYEYLDYQLAKSTGANAAA